MMATKVWNGDHMAILLGLQHSIKEQKLPTQIYSTCIRKEWDDEVTLDLVVVRVQTLVAIARVILRTI
jgi:hypothetical protein